MPSRLARSFKAIKGAATYMHSTAPRTAQTSFNRGASPWGTDWLGEVKVPSPFTTTHHAGRGTATFGGTCTDVGHEYAFGNTEELLHVGALGCPERGSSGDGPFNHSSGRGWVKKKVGDYVDALDKKNNQVALLLVEVMGGINRRGQQQLRLGGRCANDKKRGHDTTPYSRCRRDCTSYLTYHSRAISGAAVFADAGNIDRGIVLLKQSAMHAVPAASSSHASCPAS
jgi:hypothetical protein